MARKTLLTEGEIRQFMKLACLEPIGSSRMTQMGHTVTDDTLDEGWNEPKGHGPGKEAKDGNGKPSGQWLKEEEDELAHELGATEDELGAEDALAGEEGAELDDLEMDDAGTAENTPEELVMSLLDLVADWASDHNVDMSVDGDGSEEALPVDDVEAELDVVDDPMGGGEEMDLEMGAEEVPGSRYQENQEAIVQEVAKRVAARLAKQNQNHKMVDQLAERILNRLTGAK